MSTNNDQVEVKVVSFGEKSASTYLLVNLLEGVNPKSYQSQFMYSGNSAPFTYEKKKFTFFFQDTSKKNVLN